MSTHIEYASFLIRLSRQTNLDSHGQTTEWNSEVEHIQSGKCWTFNSLDDLLVFLRWQAENPQALSTPKED